MEPLEGLKQPVCLACIKACAIVPDKVNAPAGPVLATKLNSCVWASGSIFPRVAEEIFHHDLQQARIASSGLQLAITNSTFRSGSRLCRLLAIDLASADKSTFSPCIAVVLTRERFSKSSISSAIRRDDDRSCCR